MTDPMTALHRALRTYLITVALLGLATLAWSLSTVFVLDDATLASAWFGVAGSGTLLVAVLIYRNAYGRGNVSVAVPEPESGPHSAAQ